MYRSSGSGALLMFSLRSMSVILMENEPLPSLTFSIGNCSHGSGSAMASMPVRPGPPAHFWCRASIRSSPGARLERRYRANSTPERPSQSMSGLNRVLYASLLSTRIE